MQTQLVMWEMIQPTHETEYNPGEFRLEAVSPKPNGVEAVEHRLARLREIEARKVLKNAKA